MCGVSGAPRSRHGASSDIISRRRNPPNSKAAELRSKHDPAGYPPRRERKDYSIWILWHYGMTL